MSQSVTYTRTINDGENVRSHSMTLSGGNKTLVNETIPAASTNLQVALAFTLAKLTFFELGCETRAITIKTNSSGSPQETFSLAAGTFAIWATGDAALFAGNVTTIYVTLAAGADADLVGVYVVDPT